jgi:hypothetical protein
LISKSPLARKVAIDVEASGYSKTQKKLKKILQI